MSGICTEVLLEDGYEGAPLYDGVRAWLPSQGLRLALEVAKREDAANVVFARA